MCSGAVVSKCVKWFRKMALTFVFWELMHLAVKIFMRWELRKFFEVLNS